MKQFVITVPKLFNSLDSHKVWIEAADSEVAVVMLFDAVWNAFRKGIVLDQLVVEQREPSWMELLLGNVTRIEDLNDFRSGEPENE